MTISMICPVLKFVSVGLNSAWFSSSSFHLTILNSGHCHPMVKVYGKTITDGKLLLHPREAGGHLLK